MPRVHSVDVCVLVAFALALLCGSAAEAAKRKKKDFEPGKARWEIKTTIPRDASVEDSTKVALKTMLAIKPPPGAKGHSRRMDHKRYASSNAVGLVEGDMITVSGWIHLVAAEPDGDYHIQVAQTTSSLLHRRGASTSQELRKEQARAAGSSDSQSEDPLERAWWKRSQIRWGKTAEGIETTGLCNFYGAVLLRRLAYRRCSSRQKVLQISDDR